jgi:acyl carrier protein
MNIDEIKKELREGVADILAKEPSELDTSAMLFDLGMDSLGLVETFVFIEKHFGGLKLLETGIKKENMETLDALAQYIAGLKA